VIFNLLFFGVNRFPKSKLYVDIDFVAFKLFVECILVDQFGILDLTSHDVVFEPVAAERALDAVAHD